MEERSDNDLILQTLKNPEDFSFIIDKYSPKLERYIRRISNISQDDRQDVLQDIFIKIYKNLNDYDFNFKFSSWVYRIAHNQLMDFFRKKKTRPQILTSKDDYDFFDLIADDIDLTLQAQKSFDKELLNECLNELKVEYKEVLVLRFLEQKNYNEISDILKKPTGTIATLLNRAKKQLKEIWTLKIK